MTDRKLNKHIKQLLDVPRERRLATMEVWGEDFDSAMTLWALRHPGTRPPAMGKAGPPPDCFTGALPPIYDGELT